MTTGIAAIAAEVIVAGIVVGVAALTVLHVAPTGLSPVRDPVSRYGTTRMRSVYRVQTLAYAVAGASAAVGLSTLPGRYTLAVALCAVFAACRAVIGWFPMDVPGAPATRIGRTHSVLAVAAFLGIALAAGAVARSLARMGTASVLATAAGGVPIAVSEILGSVMLAALLALALDRRLGGAHFGLIERVFYAAMTAWLILVAVVLAA